MVIDDQVMYQVSTLQALALGYTKPVITVGELLKHGDTGLGTFEDVGGEMIMVDDNCYQADENGDVNEASDDTGIPFSSVSVLQGKREFDLENVEHIDELKTKLDLKIEEDFGLNSMHVVRIDGDFERIDARSESPYKSQHIELKDVLKETQKSFSFDDIKGTLICIYYPDYMDGINAPGWHLHFISEDRTKGGHVFEIKMRSGKVRLDKITRVEIQMPTEPSFDTYSLKQANGDDIKKVEQGK